jgi:hypothetical protein
MPVVEFTRFRVPPEQVPAMLEARAATIETRRSDWTGFVGSLLVRIDDGDWLDVSSWDCEAAWDAALGGSGWAAAAFFGLIDQVLGQERGRVAQDDW